MQLTKRIVIKSTDPRYSELLDLCHKSKNLYNVGLYRVRQHYFETGKYLNYFDLYKLLLSENDSDLRALPSQTAQQVLRLVDRDFKSFFRLIGKKVPGKHCIPGYKEKDGYLTTIYTNQQIRKRKLESGLLSLPGLECSFDIPVTDIDMVQFVPRTNNIVLELVYTIPDVEPVEDTGKFIGIDLGIDNLAAMVFSDGAQPILVSGLVLKSINQYYNKKKAELQSRDAVAQMHRLVEKRNNKVIDQLHKLSRLIVNHAVSEGYTTIVVGYNKRWKQDTRIGKTNNQKFTSIPHKRFVDMLAYKCYLAGIQFITVDEAYTSKASSLDLDYIPGLKSNGEKVFSGHRVGRGRYYSKSGILNADVNGALNILRKVVGDEIDVLSPTGRGFVFNPVRLDVV